MSDLVTPVNVYLRLRNKFTNVVLMESSDYHGDEGSSSYICCQPIAHFELRGDVLNTKLPGEAVQQRDLKANEKVMDTLNDFAKSISYEKQFFNFTYNGLFGYQSYDTVKHHKAVNIEETSLIPDILYCAYRFVIIINHFTNELFVFEHTLEGEATQLDDFVMDIQQASGDVQTFELEGEEQSNMEEQEFLQLANKGIDYCQSGQIKQLVLSRRFQAAFKGDEFNVYRALRSISPSPYLFYFDYSSFKLFGSSQEAQIVVENGKGNIYPIAGTFKRTGGDIADAKLAQQLAENVSEHVGHDAIVEASLKDLGKNASNAKLESYREIQFYSHSIRLVSKVSCTAPKKNPFQLIADSFPSATVSGAPKRKAAQFIADNEKNNRNFYGGTVGFLSFEGAVNHALMMRAFLSVKNKLEYQAGATLSAGTKLKEALGQVDDELRVLHKAIEIAAEI